MGDIRAFATRNVAAFDDSSAAVNAVTQFDFTCWAGPNSPPQDNSYMMSVLKPTVSPLLCSVMHIM